jgi:hypothetical protein
MFLLAGDFVRNQEILNVRLKIHEDPGVDLRTHNHPTCYEGVAILLDENMGGEGFIVLHQRGRGLQRISYTHSAFDPLRFSLLFSQGELDWHLAVGVSK